MEDQELLAGFVAQMVCDTLNGFFDSISPEDEPEEYEEIKSIQEEMNAVFEKYRGNYTGNPEEFDKDMGSVTTKLDSLGRRIMIRSIPANGT